MVHGNTARSRLQVEQIGEAKVLWKKREFTTLLTVDEDERDPNDLRTAFTLIRSVSCPGFLPSSRCSVGLILPHAKALGAYAHTVC